VAHRGKIGKLEMKIDEKQRKKKRDKTKEVKNQLGMLIIALLATHLVKK
jgi:hypothetical protein